MLDLGLIVINNIKINAAKNYSICFQIMKKNLILSLSIALSCFACLADAQVMLISEEESKYPNAQTIVTRAITRGPTIKLVSPPEVPAKLFAVKLSLEARGGAKIDSNSLRVEYLKQPLVDLTPRFKPGLEGNFIELNQVTVPEGQHAIRVSIKDSEGREGSQTFQLHAK